MATLISFTSYSSDEVVGEIDIHAHIAGHIAYRLGYGKGPIEDEVPSGKDIDHTAKYSQKVFEPLLQLQKTKLYLVTHYVNSITGPFTSQRALKRNILKQMEYVEEMAKNKPDVYEVATTPKQARKAIHEGKIVFVHGLEGATNLITSKEDVKFWKDRGMSVIGPIHLGDNQFGAAQVNDATLKWLNLHGRLKSHFAKRHGLSGLGKILIEEMLKQGIVLDLAHMSKDSREDSFKILKKYKAPPIYSHGVVKRIRNEVRGISKEEINEIYQLGGIFGVSANMDGLYPYNVNYENYPRDYCKHSYDDFVIEYNALKDILVELGIKSAPIAWGSDWNGGIANLKPKYGSKGCFSTQRITNREVNGFDVHGLAHIGYYNDFVSTMQREGVDLSNYNKSAEGFLQLWEKAIQ